MSLNEESGRVKGEGGGGGGGVEKEGESKTRGRKKERERERERKHKRVRERERESGERMFSCLKAPAGVSTAAPAVAEHQLTLVRQRARANIA
ncbi:hypothetical protein T4E_2895 [Trichinella pseudospiralis]|uniref:Uncharacterized protein n=1 Tax=Trichinella pseudospiralis TaxID=6337 RepID=A0A0V0YNA9_TRIPS|nr:hypothetical protein T4E_2895 [Trichinella pseudospiralis]